MKDPLLSIILPNFNHAHLLPYALESVLAQTFEDFELIIVDDGSTDQSVETITLYMKKDRRIRLLRHKQNAGIAAGYATALKVVKGIYLHQFSATDAYRPGFLDKCLYWLKQYPQIGMCCTDVGLFTDDPEQSVSFQLIKEVSTPMVFPHEKIEKIFKYAHFSIPGLSSIVKKESFLRFGGYHPELRFMSDWYLTHQIALFEGAIYIPEPLVVFREPGYSKITSSDPKLRRETLQYLAKLVLQKENRIHLKKMARAASLGLLCKEKLFEVIRSPRLWPCYLHLVERYLYKRLRLLLKQPLVTQQFLKKHSI
jgi:glycosyltransferase involved in cell wall biosynthesis